jgi:hypothetical protein
MHKILHDESLDERIDASHVFDFMRFIRDENTFLRAFLSQRALL